MKKFFSFPNPVNDAAARTVALGVLTMAIVALATNTAVAPDPPHLRLRRPG